MEVDSLSELGIYGTFLRKGDKVLLNREAGHLVRTKVFPSPPSLISGHPPESVPQTKHLKGHEAIPAAPGT